MAVAIALDKPKHPASSGAQNAPSASSANLSAPRGNAPFAALLAKAQAQGPRRTGESHAVPQRPDSHASTTTDSAAKTPGGPSKNSPASPSAHSTAGTPAQPHAVTRGPTNTASGEGAGNVTEPPTPALPPAAAVPEPEQNAAADASAQADVGTADPAVSEQSATVAAAVILTLNANSALSDEADTSADLDVAAAGTSTTTSGKPVVLPTPAPSGEDPTTADGALLLQHASTDAAASSPSPQAAPQSAHIPPGSPEWAEARETVALRMAHAVEDGVQNVSIDLHPAELGHVGIELTFHAGGVTVQMTLSRQETYDAFARDRAAIEQQLAQTGLNLGSGGLDLRFDQKRDQPPAFSETSFTTGIQPLQPDLATHRATLPRIANGLLNIIA